MNKKPKYKELHEERYLEMKELGLKGWGGKQVTEREIYWNKYWSNWIKESFVPEDFPRNGALLELGAGAGNISPIMVQAGYQVTGIEISPTAVEIASINNPGIRYYEGSITDLSRFASDSFDIVFDGLCLHCIIGEDRSLAFKEIYRVLRPGGFFLFNSICNDPKRPDLLKDFDPKTRCHYVHESPYRYLGKKDALIDELKSFQFFIVHHVVEENPDGDSIRLIAQKV